MILTEYLRELPRGGKAALARAAGMSPAYLYQISAGIRPIPPDRVLAIEAATEYQVSRHELRPDLYPKEPWCQCPACLREREEAA